MLGPLLFLLYINDLPNTSELLDFYLFAIDTNIYYESDSLELGKLWMNVNRLSLNKVTQIMLFFIPFNQPLVGTSKNNQVK